ncbi:MAG: crossover junction endodeoxyribonuclease RuvC [bacterium]|nr:crossover junction endodeoxyribonuclease RuvC [bacterium]
MLILGIDPGTATTGYGLIKTDHDDMQLIDKGRIDTDKDGEPHNRLAEIYKQVLVVLKKHSPDVMAIEKIFFATNAKTAIRVGQAQGVFLLAAAHSKIAVFEYAPMQIKSVVTGDGRADKKVMQEVIKKAFNIEAPPKQKTHFNDVCDGIAVAVCHAKMSNGYTKPKKVKKTKGR